MNDAGRKSSLNTEFQNPQEELLGEEDFPNVKEKIRCLTISCHIAGVEVEALIDTKS